MSPTRVRMHKRARLVPFDTLPPLPPAVEPPAPEATDTSMTCKTEDMLEGEHMNKMCALGRSS
jgi:hypothetical protein